MMSNAKINIVLIIWSCILLKVASMTLSHSQLQLAGNGQISNANQANSSYYLNVNVTETVLPDNCPSLDDAATLTQTQLITRLTDSCRYDNLEAPTFVTDMGVDAPVDVYARLYIYVLKNLDSSTLQFKMQALLQLRYQDARLAFANYAPQRTQAIYGEASLRDLVWVPHIFLANEQSSSVLGTNEKDVLTTISPNGMVLISARIEATLFCWMNFQKFPFDEQNCTTVLESWMYNTSQLQLHWEHTNAVSFDAELQLTEYELQGAIYNETISISDAFTMTHGALVGNYSSLSFSVLLTREVGYYVIDYFLPSIMIVAISWVSFWLQADQTPARTTLGCTTLLAFITLSQSQEKNLSKVSYVTMSEVWFLVCTIFIFGSLVEFAFVNTIWRRNNNLELKKRSTKYIVKSTFVPNLKKARSRNFNRSQSTCSMDKSGNSSGNSSGNTVITIETPIIIADDLSRTNSALSLEDNATSTDASTGTTTPHQTFATMTPKEVSLWIDRKMRFIFPLAFIIFNALFWSLVYCL